MPFSRSEAPGELKALHDFCNSARFLRDEDAFSDTDSAMTWLRGHELVAEDLELDDRALDRLVRVREVIRDHVGGVSTPETSGALNDYARTTLDAQWTATGQPVLRPRDTTGTNGLIGRLLAILFTTGTRGELARLKVCRAEDCRWVFYDRSPAKNSVWCSMDTCGARHKMRAYRSRRSTG